MENQIYGSGLNNNVYYSVPNSHGVKINLLEGIFESGFSVPEAKTKPSAKNVFFSKSAKILAIAGITLFIIYFAPTVFNYFKYKLSDAEVSSLTAAAQNAKTRSLPIFNPLLSKKNIISIPSIGVNTEIEEATYDNYESALKKGVWRVSNFGQPDKTGAPIILAAHRYGYLAWTNSYRHYNSFYNLPKVKEGDTIVIDWQQREYTYGVYKVENGREITDYSADVILYTCESLSGEERIFVYAKLLS